MRSEWLHRHNAPILFVFFNGWSMDCRPLAPLAAQNCDVLVVSDYRNLDLDWDLAGFSASYDRTVVIAWSMGVWAAQKVLVEQKSLFHSALAVNGTLCPLHDHFGIPPAIFAATRQQFDETARLKFYRRMCRKKEILSTFVAHQPVRTLDDQLAELIVLESLVDCHPVEGSIYDRVLISDQDYIMPTENQRAFWQNGQGRLVQEIAAPHFPFYRWASWEELLTETGGVNHA
ncbi:MAG: DUF452 family protein [Desulfobulbaceae bacterium]|uniref:DUF452 family protein n=1 Tax=Candidatus Desulfatifera sulfidica TaxID=2841691 RepID=A0A8J6T9P5_9BACT|nr:DUF452 family protein [Candidatus Desulfatifera sulfidica]